MVLPRLGLGRLDRARRRRGLASRPAGGRRTKPAPEAAVNWKLVDIEGEFGPADDCCWAPGRKPQPPVTLICRLTLGRLCRRSMMKSWPFGFRPMALSIAELSRSLSTEARSGLRKSEASSWPRH